jgi:hypothetical protein
MLGNVRGHVESQQNNTFVHALQRLAATETTKTSPLRDFRSSSIFDFFDRIDPKRTKQEKTPKNSRFPLVQFTRAGPLSIVSRSIIDTIWRRANEKAHFGRTDRRGHVR